MKADENHYDEPVASMNPETAQLMQPAAALQLPGPWEREFSEPVLRGIAFLHACPLTCAMDTTMGADIDAADEDLLTNPEFDAVDKDLLTSPEFDSTPETSNETAFPVPDEGRPVTFNPLGGCKNHTGTFKRPLLECSSGDLACSGLGKCGRRALQASRPPTIAQDEPPRQEAIAPAEQPEVASTAGSELPSAPVTPPRGLRQLRQWPSTATKACQTESEKRMVIHHQAYGQSYVLKNNLLLQEVWRPTKGTQGRNEAHEGVEEGAHAESKVQPSTASSPPA